jgi:hypothetical protein
MDWLIRKFSIYKNQITHKTESGFVEQFAIAINPVPGNVDIGQLLLDEQVKRGRGTPTNVWGNYTTCRRNV